jgi:hypothetical protein
MLQDKPECLLKDSQQDLIIGFEKFYPSGLLSYLSTLAPRMAQNFMSVPQAIAGVHFLRE